MKKTFRLIISLILFLVMQISTVMAYSGTYIFPYSDTVLISQNQLATLDHYTLLLAKNEIFARHGYVFKDQNLANYFNSKSWYFKDYSVAGALEELNSVERANFNLIDAAYNGELSYQNYNTYTPSYRYSSSYIFPYSDTTLISRSELATLDQYTLLLAKNEIFARHGYVFKDQSLANYFNSKSWYFKDYNVAGALEELNSVERANFNLIDAAYNGELSYETYNRYNTYTPSYRYSSSYIFPYSDTTLISRSELARLDHYTLLLAKNEIFARHGYVFKDQDLANYFNSKPWYFKNYNVAGALEELNAVERANFNLINDAYNGY